MPVEVSDAQSHPERSSEAVPAARVAGLPSWAWILLLVYATGVAFVRSIDGLDSAIANIVTLVCSFLTGLAIFVWFCFYSGYNRTLRLGLLFGLPLALAVPVALFRVEEVSGSLIPVLRPRWTSKPDQLLAAPKPIPEASGVDLVTTTPDDYSQFLGPQRNCSLPGPTLARDWAAKPPKLLWRQPIGAGWSAFSVVNGFAVTLEQRGEDELVTCYDALTGKPQWVHAEHARHDTVLGGAGPRSTPTVFQGKVYTLGATGILNCLDGATGKPLWTHRLQDEYHVTAEQELASVAWGRAASPLIVDDQVVVPAGGPVAGPFVSLVAFQKDSGKKIWEAGSDQIGYSSPALVTLSGVRQILSVNEQTITGHDPETGNVFWTFPWPGASNQSANTSQPVAVADDKVFISKGYTGGSCLFNVECDSAGVWTTKPVWASTKMMKTKFTNVVVDKDHVYGLSDGTLECMELATGKRCWKQGRFGHGQILGVGDLLIVQAESGDLALVAINPEAFQELSHIPALEGKTWNNPALFGRYLLVRNGEQAACFELPLEK